MFSIYRSTLSVIRRFSFCASRMTQNERGKTLFEDMGTDPSTTALTVGGPGVTDMERATDVMIKASNALLRSADPSQTALLEEETRVHKVSLVTGSPGEADFILASDIMLRSTNLLLSNKSLAPMVMQYGPRQGSPAFRDQLARLLSANYGDDVKSESLFVTPGATSGLHLVGSVFFPSEGTPAFIEDPTYFIAIHILNKEMNMKVIPVKTDPEGTDLNDLEARIKETRAAGSWSPSERFPFWAMMYLVPTFNNPRGIIFPAEKCKALVGLARKYDLLLMCDDVYNLLSYNKNVNSPPRLLTYDQPSDPDYGGGHVISNGSFSKILGPGLRVGWIETSPRIIKSLVFSNIPWSAGSLNHYTTEVLAIAMETGDHQKHLDYLSAQLASRAEAVSQLLRQRLPQGGSFHEPEGGYFIWIQFPQEIDVTQAVADLYKNHNIRVLLGSACSPNKQYANCVRISVSYYTKDVLLDSVNKLLDIVDQQKN